MTTNHQPKWLAGLWLRIWAALVDIILLICIFTLLDIFFGDFFDSTGVNRHFLNFCMALGYYGIGNSCILNGQTFGKKLCKIRVVTRDNQTISLIKSFGRFCVLGIPVFLNNTEFRLDSFLIFIANTFFVFGVDFSLPYLYICNCATRQSVHDLVFDTYVVNSIAETVSLNKIWRPHFNVVGFFCIASVLIPALKFNDFQKIIAEQSILNSQQMVNPALQTTLKTLLLNPLVKKVTIKTSQNLGNTTLSDSNGSDLEGSLYLAFMQFGLDKPAKRTQNTPSVLNDYIYVVIDLKEPQANEALAQSLAEDIVQYFPEAIDADAILMSLNYEEYIVFTKLYLYSNYIFGAKELHVKQ